MTAVVVFFVNLGGPLLWDEDEPKNAVCAREMFDRGDWVVPTFNQQLRTDKPILFYWLTLVAYHAFGVSEFSARFSSALLSAGTVLLTVHLGRVLFSIRAGVWGGIALASCLTFAMSARAATPDATLIFFTTAGMTIFVSSWQSMSRQPGSLLSFRAGVALYAVLGFAVLAKGPVGLLLPIGVICTFVALSDMRRPLSFRQIFGVFIDSLRRIRFITGAAVALFIAAPWYIAVGVETGWEWNLGFLQKHNVSRFLEPMEGHSGSIFYYLPVVLLGVLPWSLPLIVAMHQSILRVRTRDTEQRPDLFLLIWIGLYLAFFSVARTKLPSYVLPCYPALAVLVGRLIDGWLTHAEAANCRAWRYTFACGCALGVIVCLGGFVAGHIFLDGEPHLALVGLIPLSGSVVGGILLRRGHVNYSARAFGLMAVLFQIGLLSFAGTSISRHQVSAPFAQSIRDSTSNTGRIATLNYFPPSLAFYANRCVEQLRQPVEALQHLRDNPDGFLVLQEEHAETIIPHLPDGMTVLDHRPVFLRPRKTALLIGRKPQPGTQSFDAGERRQSSTINAN